MAVRKIDAGQFPEEVLGHEGHVLVDFYADWCPPCRALAPVLDQFAQENVDRVKVVKVDVDNNEELGEQYGVRTIPTLIAFRGGREVNRAVNPRNRSAIQALIVD